MQLGQMLASVLFLKSIQEGFVLIALTETDFTRYQTCNRKDYALYDYRHQLQSTFLPNPIQTMGSKLLIISRCK